MDNYIPSYNDICNFELGDKSNVALAAWMKENPDYKEIFKEIKGEFRRKVEDIIRNWEK